MMFSLLLITYIVIEKLRLSAKKSEIFLEKIIDTEGRIGLNCHSVLRSTRDF